MLARFVAALCLTAGLTACSSGPGPVADDPSGSGSGSATGATGSGPGGGGPPAPAPLVASFVAETEPGEAPAMVRLLNETKEILTIQIGLALMQMIKQGTTSSPTGVVTADLPADLSLSIHTTDGCVKKPIDDVQGPSVLEAGRGYLLHVTKPEGANFHAVVTEDAEAPAAYVGLRPRVFDPSSGPPGTWTDLAISFVGAPDRRPVLWYSSVEYGTTGEYDYIRDPEPTINGVRLYDKAGVTHRSDDTIALEGAAGFTVVVDTKPHEDAVHVVELSPEP
jgi:hypothetical protein